MPLAALPAFLIVGVLTVGGVIGVVRTSLQDGLVAGDTAGRGAWARTLADPAFGRAIGVTVWVALTSTMTAVALALALALTLRRSGRARAALAVPVAAPHLVVAALAVVWVGPGGLVDRLVGAAGGVAAVDRTTWAVIGVYVAKEAPFLALLAFARLDQATTELEATAALLGAGRWARLRDVILPRLLVPLVAGGLVTAAFVIGAVEVPLLVGPTSPRMLGPYALDAVRRHGPVARADAAVAELVAAVITGVLGLGAGLVVRRLGWPGPGGSTPGRQR